MKKRKYIYAFFLLILILQSCQTLQRKNEEFYGRLYYRDAQRVLGIKLPKEYKLIKMEQKDVGFDYNITFVYGMNSSDRQSIIDSISKDSIQIENKENEVVLKYFDSKQYDKWIVSIGEEYIRIQYISI